MITRTWKVYGRKGHRQRTSFFQSCKWDLTQDGTKTLEVECADKTGTNDYTVVHITAPTADECFWTLLGQLSDGFFENSNYGEVVEVL